MGAKYNLVNILRVVRNKTHRIGTRYLIVWQFLKQVFLIQPRSTDSRFTQGGKGITGLVPRTLCFSLFRGRRRGKVSGTGGLVHQGKWLENDE